MSNHTPAPWGIEYTPNALWVGPLRRDGSGEVAEIAYSKYIATITPEALAKAKANAEHIVACVNGCIGVNPAAVDEIKQSAGSLYLMLKSLAERLNIADDTTAAVSLNGNVLFHLQLGSVLERAEAALAKGKVVN